VSPSTNQSAHQRDRLECASIREQIGEDPARWLDWDFLADSGRKVLVMSLINGIDDMQRLRAWRAVERRLAARDDREPRGPIMQRLDQREQWLELHGERPDRLPFGPRQSCDCCDADGFVTAAELRERDKPAVEYNPESAVSVSPKQTTEAATIGEFATDGRSDE
jgi:hypothetical protein